MNKKQLLVSLAALLLPAGAAAQYVIYPVPQEQVAGTDKVNFTSTVTLVCEEGIDAYTVNRAKQVLTEAGLKVETANEPSANQSNVLVGVKGSKGVADAKAEALGLKMDVFGLANKYDRHLLSLSDGGNGRADLLILGENTDAAFFGFASLEQMFDAGTQAMAVTTLYDYADQKSRGLVEGYYGYPYTVEVKKDLMRFMMRHKMNTYMYGAKSDPYHSQFWGDAYPESLTPEQVKNGWLSQDMIKDITSTSHETKVNFIWAIHPGNNFVSNGQTVINQIMGKYEKMYDLGVRQFAVFVDDVAIPNSDADMKKNADQLTALQRAIEAKWNTPGTAANDTVRPLHFVPQIYCRSFAGSQDQHDRFFRALAKTPKYITIYTTGNGVWSVPNDGDFNTPATPLEREVAWWWNYPCNDNADGQIYPSDMYYNFFEMPAVGNNSTLPNNLSRGQGIVSNPMQQGEVSKTPLFSVADYAWNHSGFNNKTSWEASFAAVLPGNEEAQKAYKFLVPYLRWNNADELITLINAYKQNNDGAALQTLMQNIMANADVLIKMKDATAENERLLYKDLAPWLLRLRAMAEAIDGFISVKGMTGNDDSIWQKFVTQMAKANELDTKEEYLAYALEGMGTGISVSVRPSQPSQKSMPAFVEYLKQNSLGSEYLQQEAAPTRPMGVTNIEGVKMSASGTTVVSPTTSGKFITMNKGDWMGLQLPNPTKVEKIVVADTLISKHKVVLSPDGKQWTRLFDTETTPEGYVRYVGVLNDKDTPVQVRLTSQSIRVTTPAATRVTSASVPNGDFWDNHTANLMHDGKYNTFVCLNRNQQNNDEYKLTLAKEQAIDKVRVVMGTVNGDHMNKAVVEVSADGKKWTALKIKGTKTTTFTMDMPQVMPYSDEAKICDFDGEMKDAKYVRLRLTEANTSKWLRLYEIEVNGEGAFAQLRCTDGNGGGYAQVSDANPSTSTANATKTGKTGMLTYYFQNFSLINGVTLFTDPATMEGVTMEYTTDLETWTPLNFEVGVGVIRLSLPAEVQNLAALRINWTGDTAPAIYELVEKADENKKPVVSKIEQITGSQSAQSPVVSLQNHTLKVSAAQALKGVSLYTLDGRLLANVQCNGEKAVALPLLNAGNEVIVAKVTLDNGESFSYKLK